MAAVPETRSRCMIWLGRPTGQEREVLAAAGWDLRVIEDARGARIGLRGGDRVAALLDLRHADDDWVARMQALLDWLRPQDTPRFVLLPRAEYKRLQAQWQLPALHGDAR